MKVKKQKEVKKDEFRQNKKTHHPAYIYARQGNEFKFIGITHAPVTRGVKNIKLDKNPNPNDEHAAYILPKADKLKISNFKYKEKDWKLTKKDKKKVDKIKK